MNRADSKTNTLEQCQQTRSTRRKNIEKITFFEQLEIRMIHTLANMNMYFQKSCDQVS